jgi:hypothetical protein
MATYALILETERCPDGIERRQPNQRKAATFHFRTARREPLKLELQDLENPVVVKFVNARDEGERYIWRRGKEVVVKPPRKEDRIANFLSRYGMLEAGHDRESQEFFDRCRQRFFHWLHDAGDTAPGELKKINRTHTLDAIHDLVKEYGVLDLKPMFDLGGDGGTPRMLLQSPGLLAFMTMEVAMIALNDAQFKVCGHCDDVFVTGPLTQRRSHATYCSDRCRVAAMRERNREKGK